MEDQLGALSVADGPGTVPGSLHIGLHSFFLTDLREIKSK